MGLKTQAMRSITLGVCPPPLFFVMFLAAPTYYHDYNLHVSSEKQDLEAWRAHGDKG
jgi:hypothetical protein